jgi:hypothetical protein
MSGFDNRKTLSYRADAPSFTAKIAPGTAVQTAIIAYKAGFKIGPPSVTASTMDQLMAALLRLDAGVKFYKTGAEAGTLSAKDAATLENLRTDSRTSDSVYRTACASYGVKPQVRNIQSVTANTSAPQAAPTLSDSVVAWGKFEREHAELFTGVFAQQNLKTIENWFADEPGAQWTAANLATCYAELKAAGNFRDARTLSRDLNGSLQIAQPYSRERILAMRRQQAVDVATAPPAHLSEADQQAWAAVRQSHPGVPVNSPAFKQLCASQVLAWAKESVLENQPELAASNKRGELSVAINKVLVAWSRNPNLGQGQKTIKDTRIWLG